MSNRSFASMYNGSSSVGRSSSGGSDIFGLQAKRQKDIMNLQHQLELETMQKGHEYDTQDEQLKGDIASKARIQQIGLEAAKSAGFIPPGTTYDVLSKDMQDQINELGRTHLALQQKVQDSQEFQDASVKGGAALQAKPFYDNQETMGRTRALSTTIVPPNTGVSVAAPGGVFGTSPLNYQGATQRTTLEGGIKDPTTGQTIGGKPVETYGPVSFPPVGKINLGDSQNLTNNISAKPTMSNMGISGQPSRSPFSNPALDQILSQPYTPPTQPPAATNPLMTKPPVPYSGTGPYAGTTADQSPYPDIAAMLKKFMMMRNQGPQKAGGIYDTSPAY